MDTPLYPAFLNLQGKCCVVVGAGPVAKRKAAALLEAGAEVIVVAPEANEEAFERGGVRIVKRRYRAGDLRGAWLAVAATDDAEVNRRVAEDADAAGIWVNVADKAAASTFMPAAAVRRGRVVAAVSTAGASPALAARLRDRMAEALPEECGDFAAWLAAMRPRVQEALSDAAARERVLREMAGDAVFEAFRRRGRGHAEALAARLIEAAKSQG